MPFLEVAVGRALVWERPNETSEDWEVECVKVLTGQA